MNKIKVGHFEPDGSDIFIPVGFVPDYVRIEEVGQATNPNIITWFKAQETDEATGSQEGQLLTGSTGVVTKNADDAGLQAFDTGSQAPTVTEWSESGSTAATARTATAAGTYFKPTVSSDTDRSAIFECVTAGTAAATEPTWPDAVGGQVTDGTVVWERVDKSLERQGYQGFKVADNLMTNGTEMYYIAFQSNQSIDHGDVDGWTGGVDPDAN